MFLPSVVSKTKEGMGAQYQDSASLGPGVGVGIHPQAVCQWANGGTASPLSHSDPPATSLIFLKMPATESGDGEWSRCN